MRGTLTGTHGTQRLPAKLIGGSRFTISNPKMRWRFILATGSILSKTAQAAIIIMNGTNSTVELWFRLICAALATIDSGPSQRLMPQKRDLKGTNNRDGWYNNRLRHQNDACLNLSACKYVPVSESDWIYELF